VRVSSELALRLVHPLISARLSAIPSLRAVTLAFWPAAVMAFTRLEQDLSVF
jgi:hypothetical protein